MLLFIFIIFILLIIITEPDEVDVKTNPKPDSSNQSLPGYETKTNTPAKTAEVGDNENNGASWLCSTVLLYFIAITLAVLV